MDKSMTELGIKVRLNVSYNTAIARTIDTLKVEGFGVLTEIDVKETLKKKLDVDFRPYKILGACNPSLAHQALSIAPEIGLLLPCNVTVSYVEDNVTDILIVNPIVMLGFVNRPELEPIAAEARSRLDRVAQMLQKSV